MYNLKTGITIKLQQDGDRLYTSVLNKGGNENYLLTETEVNQWETSRLSNDEPKLYIVNTDDGTRRCIAQGITNGKPSFSPDGKFVIWYDTDKQNYYTFNLVTGLTSNITKAISTKIYNEKWDRASQL